MANYYRALKIENPFPKYVRSNGKEYKITEHERGLDQPCTIGGDHDWLLLPKEDGQKQYLICLKCAEPSHL